MVAYTYQMPSGIPGNLTRVTSYPNVEAQMLNQSTPPTAFGVPVKMSSGTILTATGSGDTVYGFLVRPYPTSGNGTDGLGTSTPNKALPADIMVKGYMNVFVQLGTPSKDSAVYRRTANASAGQPLGGIEATSNGNNTQITNAYFTGAADASGNAEIAFNI